MPINESDAVSQHVLKGRGKKKVCLFRSLVAFVGPSSFMEVVQFLGLQEIWVALLLLGPCFTVHRQVLWGSHCVGALKATSFFFIYIDIYLLLLFISLLGSEAISFAQC